MQQGIEEALYLGRSEVVAEGLVEKRVTAVVVVVLDVPADVLAEPESDAGGYRQRQEQDDPAEGGGFLPFRRVCFRSHKHLARCAFQLSQLDFQVSSDCAPGLADDLLQLSQLHIESQWCCDPESAEEWNIAHVSGMQQAKGAAARDSDSRTDATANPAWVEQENPERKLVSRMGTGSALQVKLTGNMPNRRRFGARRRASRRSRILSLAGWGGISSIAMP